MAADTYDPILGLILQGTGNNNNVWGTICNTSMISPAARAIAGVNTITSTGGNVDLSATVPPAGLRADIDMIQHFTGALVSNLVFILPNVSKLWWIQNDTTNAFGLYVKLPTFTNAQYVQIPQGVGVMLMCDGNNNLRRHDDAEIGSIRISAKAAVGAGELACNGASLARLDYPNLFAKIGTMWGSVDGTHFTIPNFTDTARFLRSSSGSLSVGTYQSNQNAAHTHAITGAPFVNITMDAQGSHTHTASVSDPGHSHAFTAMLQQGSNDVQFGTAANVNNGSSVTSPSGTGIGVSIQSAGLHTHNLSGSVNAGTLGTASSGGTEARPESAVVLFGLRY